MSKAIDCAVIDRITRLVRQGEKFRGQTQACGLYSIKLAKLVEME